MLAAPNTYRALSQADKQFGYWPGKNKAFTGRETELAAIAKQLQGKGSGVSVIHDAQDTGAASGIVGLGGVGKTQLAAEYFHQCVNQQKNEPSQSYALQLWLRGSDVELLSADIRRLATWLGFHYDEKTPLDIVSSRVYQRLATFSAKAAKNLRPGVLWVVDGADSEAVQKLLPKGDLHKHFHWLITSRHESMWQTYFSGVRFQSLRLQSFRPDEALDYLRHTLTPVVQRKSDCTDENLRKLSEQLGYLPLALSLAAAYLNRNERFKTVTAYCNATQDYLSQFASMPAAQINGYERTILITWLIELPDLLSNNPKAVELLLACSYLSGERIPLGLLGAYWGDVTNTSEAIYEQVINNVQWLQEYSLIDILGDADDSPSHAIGVHPLLQQIIRRWLEGDLFVNAPQAIKKRADDIKPLLAEHAINQNEVLEKLLSTLGQYSDKQASTVADLQRRIEIIPHLKAVLNFQSFWPNHMATLREANLRHRLGLIYLQAQGNALLGRDEFEKVLAIVERHHGKDHPEVAKTLANLGNAVGDLGDASRQKALLERALPIFERHVGKDHPHVAKTLVTLGNAVGDLGDASRRKALLERALAIGERYYGKDHPEVAATLASLGTAYGALGDASRARALLERALAIKGCYYGKDHPEVAATLASLGTAYGALGDASRQQALLERALIIKERHYGKDHPKVAITLASLGIAVGALGDASRAKALLERALAIQKCYYGKDHPEVAATLTNLGNAYGALGDSSRQQALLERALAIDERHYGKDHPEVAATLASLGTAYGALGDSSRQQALLEQALRIYQQNPAYSNHPYCLRFLQQIAKLKQRQRLATPKKSSSPVSSTEENIKRLGQKGARCYKANNFAEAKMCYQRLVDLLNPKDGDIASLRSAYFNLAETYQKLKKWQKAKQTFETLIELQQHEPAPMPSQIQKAQQQLGQCETGIMAKNKNKQGLVAFKAKNYEQAASCFHETLALTKKVYTEENGEIAFAHYNLGAAYQEAGNDSAAQEHLCASWKIRQRLFGDAHEITKKTHTRLAKVKLAADEFNSEASGMLSP